MILRQATSDDNAALVQFYKDQPIRGRIQLQSDRSPDFSGLYKLNSDRFLTYLLEESNKEIFGLASFISKNLLLDGISQNVLFACDLRISAHRRATLEWSKHFLPTMREAQSKLESQHIFTIINRTESLALNAFLRPRIRRPNFPTYHFFRGLGGIAINGKFPWAKAIVPSLRIKPFTSQIESALWDYLFTKSQRKELSPFPTLNHVGDFFSDSGRYHKEDFLVATDPENKIVGCTLPWSPRRLVDLTPLSFDKQAQNFRQFLIFARWLGWARALTQNQNRNSAGNKLDLNALNMKYLSFHHGESHYAHEALLEAAFHSCDNDEFLFYMRDQNEIHLKRPRYWIGAEIPYGLYFLNFDHDSLPSFFTQKNRKIVSVDHPMIG